MIAGKGDKIDTSMDRRFSAEKRIGFLGDAHGDLGFVLDVSRRMRELGVFLLVVLGDFGFIWPKANWERDLDKLGRRFAERRQVLMFVDGNHENFDNLAEFAIREDGLRWVRPNIAHIPRGYRAKLRSGRTLAALGGANSIDFEHRREGSNFWKAESITDADLQRLGCSPADVLIGHDAPVPLPSLDAHLVSTEEFWSRDGLTYSRAGREQLTRAFVQVRPALYLGGHMHRYVDETVSYGGAVNGFQTRVILLDRNRSPIEQCAAILNVDSLDVVTLRAGDAPAPMN